MKKDWTKRMLKNGLMAVFALAMICCGMSFLGMEGNEVHAAEAAVANEEGYVVKQYDDISTYKTNSSYPILSADEYSDAQDWLFAGWYTTEACNTSIGTTATGGAWAKFVHIDVLSVKCQIETGTDEETTSTNMRLISTIDSLAYDTVGFKVRYNGGKELDFPVSTVFKRINASEENGNECGYSPAAFHNTSEYFMTYSLLDIKNQNFSKSFYIEPYWITLDGTEVSGASRFARVEDQYLEIVNVPVRLHQDAMVTGGSATVSYNIVDSDETVIYEPYTVNDVIQYDNGTVFDAVTVEANAEAKNVTVTASEQSESVAANGLLVNLRFKMIADGMPSLSEFAITSDEFVVSNFIFRNFPLTYGGKPDVSWYTGHENSDTFAIASVADLYGLAALSNGTATEVEGVVDFAGKTIYLASDITINTLAEGETTANWATTAPTHSWTPIGASTAFAGTFDGQGNSIRGLYAMNTTAGTGSNDYQAFGLFGTMSGDIKNLKLKDSFLGTNAAYTKMGSVVGILTGNMSNVYSDAYISNSSKKTNSYSGGLVGDFAGTGTNSISNCWYDGTLVGYRYVGGIAALVQNGTEMTVENCLVSGNVQSKYTAGNVYHGGLVGQVHTAKEFYVNDCMVTGDVSADSTDLYSVGAIIGCTHNKTGYKTYLQNVYYKNTISYSGVDTNKAEDAIAPEGTTTSVDTTTITDQQAYVAYKTEDSSFNLNVVDGSWVARYQDVPAIRSLVDDSELTYDVAWYEGKNATKVITNRDEFYGFMMLSSLAKENFEGETISLGANIRATVLYPWTPIGQSTSFAGTFDGKGKTISGIYLPMEEAEAESGLFGNVAIDGIVRNFTMKNSSICGKSKTGGVVGQLQGTVQNVYVDNTVTITSTSTAAAVGGIVGMYAGSTEKAIENCWFAGTVTGGTRCGGIVGRMYEGDKTLKNCLNTGNISGTQHVGGLIGSVYGRNADNQVTVTLRDCLNRGTVTIGDNETVERDILGSTASNIESINLENVYTTLEEGTTSLETLGKYEKNAIINGIPVGLKDDTIITEDGGYIYPDFDLYSDSNPEGAWILPESGVPELKTFSTKTPCDSFSGAKKTVEWYYNECIVQITQNEENTNNKVEIQNTTFDIKTPEDMFGLAELVNSEVEKFAGRTVQLNNGITFTNKEQDISWTPIGKDGVPFEGIFDGKGNEIDGVYLDTTTAMSGLFGNVAVDGIVRNFTMKNSSITGKGNLGGVVGYLQGTVQDVYVDDTVSITSTGAAVGGIVGMYAGNTEKAIENCWFAGTIIGGTSATRCGGIVGRMYMGNKMLKNCLNTGDISGKQHIGGLIGSVYGKDSSNEVTITLRDCLNIGSATATTTGKFGNIIGDSATNVATITMENVYTTLDEGEVALGDGSVNADLTMNGTPIVLSSDTFTTGEGYIYPEFDFYSDTNKDGVWTVSQSGMPELKAFSTGSAYDSFKGPKKTVGWYYNQYTNVSVVEDTPTTTATNEIQNATTFTIKTPEDMFGLAELVNTKVEYFAGHKVKLNNDIVFNGAEAEDAKKWYNKEKSVPEISWTPIGSTDATKFQGEFNGQGNTISGLYVNNDEGTGKATGLFGYTAGCTIQDVRLENSYLVDVKRGTSEYAYLGSVIGWGHGTLNNVYSDAILYSTGRRVGGLVGQGGYNKGTTNRLELNSCWYDGVVDIEYEGSNRLESGGMVGYAYYGEVAIDTCLFTGTIQCGYNYTGTASSYGVRIGGICGTDTTNCTLSVSNTISSGVIKVDGENSAVKLVQIQGMIGYVNNSSSKAETEVYNLTETSITVADETTIVDDVTDCLLEGKDAYVWTNLLFENKDEGTYLWTAREGKVPAPAALVAEEDKLDLTNVVRPDTNIADDATGSIDAPYKIENLAEFYGLIKLSQNDTFAGKYIQLTTDIVVDAKVYPIGSSEMPFAGYFDGNGHTISGVSMKADMEYMGLFAVVDSGATVRNFRLTDSEFYQLATSGVGYVGSIAGECRGTIDSVYSNATIESTNTRAGGIVGQTSGTATITNCWFDGEITMTGEKDPETAGGIIGAADAGTTTLTNCLFTGVVDASYNVGGFCGLVDTSADNTLNIKSSISAGTLTNPKMSGRTGSVVGRVQNGFTKSTVDEVTTYTACQTFLNLENVFVTRDCYAMSVPYVDGEDTAADEVTVVAASEVTGHVVQTLNSDRLIGYCTEEAIEGETAGAALDFTSENPAWSIRTSGTPVPSCFADFEEKVTQVDVSTLDTVLGLSDLELSLTAAVHKGLGNYVVSKTATYNEYTGYLETLETLDFEKYVDNAGMSEDETTCADDSVYNAIYLSKDADEDGVRDSDWVITVTHAKTADDTYTMYISISTGGEASLSTNLISAEQVGTAAVTLHMPKLEYTLTTTTDDVTTEYYQYGNSFVFQLPNGHFIINDGGHEVELEYLLTYLNELADTAGTDAIYIDAWTVSHQHGDHFSLMKEYYEVVEAFEKGTDAEKEEVAWFGNIKDIYVEGFYINEPNMKVVSLESNSFYLVLERQHKGVSLFKQKSGAASQVFRYQTGQRYYFNGLVMDVIQAQEQLTTDSYKGDTDWYNATSTTLLFTVNATGDKIYIGGDATTVNDNYIMTAYGAESQKLSGIDVFVATHHGKNSTETYLNYLTDNGTDKFRTVLFPCSLVYGLEEGISNGSATMPDNNIYSGAQKANQYLIDNLIQEGGSYYDYGAGTVVVTFNAETN